MEMNNRRKGVGGILLIIAFVFGISVASSMTAQAQWRNDDQYRRDRNWNDDQNRDWRREQRERREREERARRNNAYGTYGTNETYGTYGNYGNYGYNNNSYRVEQNQGYQYGVNTGASDAQRGQSYSPQRSHYYRSASSPAFRDGFVQGYDAGFRQTGGYNGGYQRSRTGSILRQVV